MVVGGGCGGSFCRREIELCVNERMEVIGTMLGAHMQHQHLAGRVQAALPRLPPPSTAGQRCHPTGAARQAMQDSFKTPSQSPMCQLQAAWGSSSERRVMDSVPASRLRCRSLHTARQPRNQPESCQKAENSGRPPCWPLPTHNWPQCRRRRKLAC